MAFRYKNTEIVVGIFVIFAVMLIIAVIIMIGSQRRWFEKRYEYNTKFLRAEGITPGMQVRIRGIQVGEVKEVFLNQDNWIEVTFVVYQEYSERIRKDSVARLEAPLIGSKSIGIIPGGGDLPVLASGSYVWSEDTEQGQRIISERLAQERPDQLQRIINNVERLTQNLSTDDGSLEPALESIAVFFEKLSSEDEALQMALANLETITAAIDLDEGSLGKFMSDDEELYDNVLRLTEQLNEMAANFEELSEVVADTSPEIQAAIERSNRIMNEALGLVKMLQNNFFVRAFSSRKRQEVAPIEGEQREGGYSPGATGSYGGYE
jgi:phospholipid/cholesterol/gamma-HCH transport system substrate-binding protein